MPQFVDTHCHLHDPAFFSASDAAAALERATAAGVNRIILIGTSLKDSRRAIALAHKYPKHCFAAVGIHPHEAAQLTEAEIKRDLIQLNDLAQDSKVVAVGECGLDFYYNKRTELLAKQAQLLRGQLSIAKRHKLPLCFHVREAFDDFWNIFKDYSDLQGVLHSFTDSAENVELGLKYGLKIGVNGIATFTTKSWQIDLFKDLTLENIVLETDAPFLTPKPRRGTINSPENVIYITDFMAELRGESVEMIANATTATATKLFNLT